jgi:hypothetical protein
LRRPHREIEEEVEGSSEFGYGTFCNTERPTRRQNATATKTAERLTMNEVDWEDRREPSSVDPNEIPTIQQAACVLKVSYSHSSASQ